MSERFWRFAAITLLYGLVLIAAALHFKAPVYGG